MVATYTIAGRQVGSHVLAMITLGSLFGTSAYFAGGSKKPEQKAPPIDASSKDEENFIQDFLKQAESENSKGGQKQ
ncbi:MAG: hypothetical protein M1820_008577 [Bogoriella megaspora]|nr:MAG: hypothetical protein M1820_008577 [Bogoriella megaspora]